ncbi:MAG: exodeoxyribonuclease VII small subunit [Ruminiclostridium sp.]|nr:exodeoxyribonuclease VII small subunit [Ruminiclostridium sp.]
MNFEEAYSRLSEISTLMEKDGLPLDEAVNLYSEAAKLVEICKKDIESAKLKIEKIENTGK